MIGREKGKIPIRRILEKRDIGLFYRIEALWKEAHEVQERQRSKEHHQQGYLHCEAVENNIGKIISDDAKYNLFSPLELFLLSVAACYHDIGKSDEFDDGHAMVAMRDIYSHPEKYHLSDPEGKVLSTIIGSHDIDEVFKGIPEMCPIGSEDVKIKLISALFRLADVLHTDNTRIQHIIVGDVKKEDDKTRFRKLIQGWSFNDESQIVLRTTPEDPNDINIIAKGVSMMQQQLDCVSPVLRSEGYPYEIIYSCDYLGIKRKAETENKRNLIDMDSYTENEADIFKGRDIESKGLLKKVISSNISLLIGNSGVGKTSLIKAGLFPKLSKMGWICIWTRPVNPSPLDRILNDINAKLPVGYESNDIIFSIKKLSEQNGITDIIIAIDQFEDIIKSSQQVKEVLGKILLRIYSKSLRNIYILLSYRGDFEPEINAFLDNSGIINPGRFPLLGLENIGAHKALRSIFETNSVGISDELLDRIIKELEKESEHGRFYPPFIQIVASSLISSAKSKDSVITEELYDKVGSVKNIIGTYLVNQLNEFGEEKSEKRRNAEKILKELIKGSAKEQKGKEELLRCLNIPENKLQELLDILVNKRLIRHLDNDNYEIIHDYLASRVEEMIKEKDTQRTFGDYQVSVIPKVRTTDDHLIDWNRNIIVKQLLRETRLSEHFYGLASITEKEAREVAKETEKRIRVMGVKFLSGPLIRELINNVLLERGHTEWRNISTRVGTPVYDAYKIDMGTDFEDKNNANLQENAETSHKKKADKISKEQYLLMLPPKLADSYYNGDIHIHDLEYMGTRAFCAGWDLRYFFYYGLMPDGSGIKARVAGPAKKAEVAILHAVKVLGSAQKNFAGGQGFYNFLTFISPYFEGMNYEEIEQLMEMFVYEMTQMMVALGGQLIFSSVQLSPGVPKLWRNKPVVYKGKVYDGKLAPLRTYGEFEREVRLAFEALMNVMLKGDYWGRPFNYPKPEISIEPDFMSEDDEFNRAHPELLNYDELYNKAFELAAKYGSPYFDNHLPEYRGAGKIISCYQCSAYNFSSSHDKDSEFEEKLYFINGKHFSMGAWQVVSLNCPRAAYKAVKNDEALFRELKNMMDMCMELFKVKRRWMDIVIGNGRMPFVTQRPKDPFTMTHGQIAVDTKGLVYTIGVVGINEMVEHHTGKQIHESEEARRLAIRAMFEMKFYAKELSKKYGMEIALARTPAEITAQRFAVSDLLHKEYRKSAEPLIKGNIGEALKRIHETHDLPIYYTNGTHVPPSADISLLQRIKLEETFFPIVDGGNIFHICLGEAVADSHDLKEFAMNIAKNTQVGYFALAKYMTLCLDDFHVFPGILDECPDCESSNVEHIVTSHLQPVSGWNEGIKQELKDMKRYGVL